MDPLQAALSQLAQTLGVAIPTSSNGDEPKVQVDQAAETKVTSETEEGELSDHALDVAKPLQSKLGKRQEKEPKKTSNKGKADLKRSKKVLQQANPSKKATTDEKKRVSNDIESNKKAEKSPPNKTLPRFVESKPRVLCRYWMEGKCTKGEECTFSHAQKPLKTPEEAKSEQVCKFFMAGNCLKGDTCLYSHDLSRVPCKFFHVKNECSAGDSCRFSHDPINEEMRHQLFAEMMGSRDPRLVSSPPPMEHLDEGRPFTSVTTTKTASSLPFQMMAPLGLIYPIPSDQLDPQVAKFNPYGNPFVK